MTPTGMAEARPDTPKKYTCACGLSQEDRKSKFSGKCRHCHTRAKYLRGQSSFDSGSASRGWSAASGGGSPGGSAGSSPNNSSSSNNSTANNSDGDGGKSSSSSRSSSSSSGGSSGGSGSGSGSGSSSSSSSTSSSNNNNRLVRQVSVSDTRRRSRSADRYDAQRITDPPPYSWVTSGSRSRETGRETARGRGSAAPVRRTGSEDSAGARRAAKFTAPPPPYEVAQNESYYQLPPSYEEALANTMTGMSVSAPVRETPPRNNTPSPTPHANLAAIVSSTVPLLPVANLNTRSSRVLEEQAAILEAQREAQLEAQRLAQRDAQREAQREAQLELDRDMERQRLRELQLAQYCGCAKCQGYYYSYYYDDAMNDGGAFPMETQVLMQEVLTDGLAFCSIM
ncbi:sericin-2-like [Palaemon carinicauda]|uniref:sericin-2-like n=1 Tax=Palaemon carinicauda TaxID=392227 RepID=UPI0035B5DB17